ncbi:iron-containing alcohol dehydrogenase [Alteromonas halophila]|uniref:Iron-containing alcohol dehydrogenase n=1 Tax=Alteromonas halophila TaxID=516698 RepID=A0A918MZK3_9ALTE|nr:iron-containing alcohol dehydrogenase [Alteromonas halophila]GGW92883.1 iron-containing alcohol dehydrogenase [Alteromonas halophila]
MSAFRFTTVPGVICEPDCVSQLGRELTARHISRPLLVTDNGIVAAGLLEPVVIRLEQTHAVGVYDGVIADPPESIVEAAVAAATAHQADAVIGLGGGSSLDTAKLIARLACVQRQEDVQTLPELYGVDQVRGTRLPLILIPTTAGTGSEATPVAVVTTGETTKAGVVSSLLLPDLALLDASLTTGLPKPVTAATGIDAMVHAIEATTSKLKRNPYSAMLADQALTLLSANIRRACEEPDDVMVRHNMLLGAFLAGQAFANAPVAGVHALAYPLGGHFHIPHGLSNALVLPHVLRHNAGAAERDYQAIAQRICPALLAQHNGAEAMARYFYALSGQLGLPQTLSECGISEADIPMLARDAMLQTRLLVNNPCTIEEDDARAIYRCAL